jgi:rubrerythrin
MGRNNKQRREQKKAKARRRRAVKKVDDLSPEAQQQLQDQYYKAEYRCLKCGHEFRGLLGPNTCDKCDHPYILWVNYEILRQNNWESL